MFGWWMGGRCGSPRRKPGILSVTTLKLDPRWDPFRDHPRFQVLLERDSDDVEH